MTSDHDDQHYFTCALEADGPHAIRRRAFIEGGVSIDDSIYTTQHDSILKKLAPSSRAPQGKGTTDYSPMMAQVLSPEWREPQKPASAAV